MACNVGQTDRVLRIGAGVAIMAAGAYLQSWWGLVGLVPFITGVVRWCPLYVPLGLSTNSCGGGCCCGTKDKPAA